MPSDVRFAQVLRLFESRSWTLVRIRGSHHVFQSPTGLIYVVPVHKNKEKYVYVREIKKLLEEDD
jgi:predicted RNA binding protein YcfA (HicA-like mRNA interferase family)